MAGIKINEWLSGWRDPIPGATVRELEHAFMAEYSNVYRAADMLHVGGLNDVLRGATDSEIMEDIWDFRTL